MKKTILITVIAIALAMSGCEAIFGSPATSTPIPTYTPAPTYTPLPTYTPFPQPTQPPAPSATLVPLESPTVAVLGVTPTDSSGGMQATIFADSWVRAGPGTIYGHVSHVSSGETVIVLGRNHQGDWFQVRTSSGAQGWVRNTQFAQPWPDARQLSEVKDYPTPSVTLTPTKPGPAPTSKPGTQTGTQGPVSTASASSGFNFSLAPGGGQVCMLVNPWQVVPPVQFTDLVKGIPPWKASDSTQQGLIVYMLDTSGLPSGLSASIQGNILPNSCTSKCDFVTFTLCASASASLAPGKYSNPVTLKFSAWDPVSFNPIVVSGIPTVFNVGQ